MHLNVVKSDLLRLLDLARTFSDKDPPKPILRNALLSVVEAGEHQLLRVTASDLLQTLTVHASCAASELGAVALSARALYDVVSTLPEGPVELREEETRVAVCAGRRVARIPFELGHEFPHMPEPDPEIPPATVDASLLLSLIDRVIRCASKDHTRPHQSSVLFEFGDGQARAVALDASSMLAVATDVYRGEFGRVAVVPLKAVKRLQTALEKHTGQVLLSLAASPDPDASDLLFQFGSIQFATKRVDRDRYPNFEPILELGLPRSMRLQTKALLDVCGAGIKVLDSSEPARAVFDLNAGELSISVTSTTGRAYNDTIDGVEHAGPARWAMNLDHIADVLAPIGSEVVEIRYVNETSPFRVLTPGDDSYTAVVSPCQL